MKMIQRDDKQVCCRNCRYWASNESKSWGRCHRYPPQFYSDEGSYGADHVATDAKEWCGEFQPLGTIDNERKICF